MKKFFYWTALLLGLILTIGACTRESGKHNDQTEFQTNQAPAALKTIDLEVNTGISAELLHGLPGAYKQPTPAYHVHVTITNHGQPIKFDRIFAQFIPPSGPPLKMLTGPDTSSNRGQTAFTMANGQKDEYVYTTDGYTDRLLQDSYGFPIKFSLEILADGRTISGPYIGELPSFDTPMPVYELVLMGDTALPFPIVLQQSR